jgi:diguanylate cyclase (GGDEF)-like protein/PAS domain S-box-containing protein
VLAADGTLLQMNRAGLNLIEAESESQIIGHKVTDIVTPQYRKAFEDLSERINRGESGTLEFEIVGLKGGHRWLDTHAVPMRDVNGQITGLLGVTRDITARKRAEQELEQLAQTDFLTNLSNRRHFMTQAEQELSRTLRYGGPLSVLMMDLDYFKKINDTYGHKTGDLVLRRFADLSRQTLREVDAIGRIGGEEFAVVLPQTDGQHALEAAERLRKLTEDAEVALEQGLPFHFTVSIGVATLTGPSTNIDTLLSQADQALYKAKKIGRNKVCVYDSRDGAAMKWHEA